jgi:hypothetical protein
VRNRPDFSAGVKYSFKCSLLFRNPSRKRNGRFAHGSVPSVGVSEGMTRRREIDTRTASGRRPRPRSLAATQRSTSRQGSPRTQRRGTWRRTALPLSYGHAERVSGESRTRDRCSPLCIRCGNRRRRELWRHVFRCSRHGIRREMERRRPTRARCRRSLRPSGPRRARPVRRARGRRRRNRRSRRH